MKLNHPKEWYERKIEAEGDSEVGAGCLTLEHAKKMFGENFHLFPSKARAYIKSLDLELVEAENQPNQLNIENSTELVYDKANGWPTGPGQVLVTYIPRPSDKENQSLSHI